MKRFGLLSIVCIGLFGSLGGCYQPSDVTPRNENKSQEEKTFPSKVSFRAVSLKILQNGLAVCQQSSCPAVYLELGGLKSILGYILDPQNSDIVLFGVADPDLPAIRVDSFVVALRNAWLEYATVQGNVRMYSYPGCDIRPDHKTALSLQEIRRRFSNSQEVSGIETMIAEWHRICRSPQPVTVMGLPFKTEFAKVMVEADYQMKTIVDGADNETAGMESTPLDVPGLPSLMELRLSEVRNAVLVPRPINSSLPPRNLT